MCQLHIQISVISIKMENNWIWVQMWIPEKAEFHYIKPDFSSCNVAHLKGQSECTCNSRDKNIMAYSLPYNNLIKLQVWRIFNQMIKN